MELNDLQDPLRQNMAPVCTAGRLTLPPFPQDLLSFELLDINIVQELERVPHNTPVGKNVTQSTLCILFIGTKVLQPRLVVFCSEEIDGKDFSHNFSQSNTHGSIFLLFSVVCQATT